MNRIAVLSLALAAAFGAVADRSSAAVLISEFMAVNDASLLDEDGDDSDWIEMVNAGVTAVDLSDWYLTDDVDRLKRWRFPPITLPAGARLIVFASEKNRRDPARELHTNFKLSSSGEYLALVQPDGTTIAHAFAPEYPPQFPDVSYGIALAGAQDVTLVGPDAPATYKVPTDDGGDVNNPAAIPAWNDPAFDDSTWTATDLAVGYTTDGNLNYHEFIGSTGDVESLMHRVNPSAYVRVPFTVANPEELTSLTLWVRYDDGFAAYINGGTATVAGAHSPADGALAYNATTLNQATNPDGDAMELVPFDIDLSAVALAAGSNLLAVHGLNARAGSSDFLIDCELEAALTPTGGVPETVYMTTATPGRDNAGGVPDLGPIFRDVTGSAPSLTLPHDTEILVTAEVEAAKAAVHTVRLFHRRMFEAETQVTMKDDGVHPDVQAGDGVFTMQIPIAGLSAGEMVRWRFAAEDADGTSSRSPLYHDPLNSAEYYGTIAGDPSITSALPVIHWFVQDTAAADGGGTRASAWFMGEFYDNFFVRRRGGSTAGFPKKSYKFDFNPRNHFRFAQDTIRAEEINLNQTWSDKAYLRQSLTFEIYDRAGSPGSESFPLRLHRNGQFHSINAFVEQPDKRLLKREDLDERGALYKMFNAVTSGTSGVEKKNRRHEDHGDLVAFVDGVNNSTGLALDTFIFDHVDVPRQLNYLVATVLSQNNDNMKKNYYLYRDSDGSGEWFQIAWDTDLTLGSHYMTRDTSAHDGIWADADYVLGGSGANVPISPSHPFVGTQELPGNRSWNRFIDRLYDNPRFVEMFRRRLRTVMDETLTPPFLDHRIAELEARLAPDAAEDFAKWGQFGEPQTLAQAVDILETDYLAVRRTHLFDTHDVAHAASYPAYPDPEVTSAELPPSQSASAVVSIADVVYNPVSGNQDEEYLCITNANAYAVDISEWRIRGGVSHTIRPGTVVPAGDVVYLTPDARAFRSRALPPHGGMGLLVQGGYRGRLNAWGETVTLSDTTGRLVSTYRFVGTPSLAQQHLRITEIMYNPSPVTAITNDSQAFEYIELRNTSTNVTLDLGGVRFSQGVIFDFAGSAVTNLSPGEYVLIVQDQAAVAARYGGGLPIAGTFDGALDSNGETLRLDDATGEKILEFDYDNAWYPVTDGHGFSLVIADELAHRTAWGDHITWRPSSAQGGSPGAADPASDIGPVLVNEVLAHTDLPDIDSIELFNPGPVELDLGGWFLTDDPDSPRKHRIHPGTTIPAGGFLALTEVHFNTGSNAFQLSEHGDSAWLFSGDAGTNLSGYAHGWAFNASPNGVSLGRYVDSLGRDHFVLQSATSLDGANAAPQVGPVVVTEFMYHPPDPGYGIDNDQDEFIELTNISAAEVPLYCTHTNEPGYGIAARTNTWRLRNAVDYDFPANVTLAAGARLLVVGFDPDSDPALLDVFRALYAVPAGVPVFGPWSGKLDNGSAEIELKRPDVPETAGPVFVPYVMVEQMTYHDAFPWPSAADGFGPALQRRAPDGFADDPITWRAAYPQGIAAPDSDADGMADWWEEANGLVVGVNDSGLDPDEDGMTNGEEEIAATDPHDPGSALRMTSIRGRQGMSLSFVAVADLEYLVQRSDALGPTNWAAWRQVEAAASNRVISVIDPLPLAAERYYRVTTPTVHP